VTGCRACASQSATARAPPGVGKERVSRRAVAATTGERSARTAGPPESLG